MPYFWGVFLGAVLSAVLSYFIGNANFAIILTKAFKHGDIRDYGSGNAGMTNVIRTAGKGAGALTFLGDFSKGIIAVLICRFGIYALTNLWTAGGISDTVDPMYFAWLSATCCMIGHVYPVLFSFRGGKGIACSAGCALVLDWRVFILVISAFLILFLTTHIISIGSIAAAIFLPIGVAFFNFIWPPVQMGFSSFRYEQQVVYLCFAILIAGVVLWRHRSNMVRLVKGEEKKITSKK